MPQVGMSDVYQDIWSRGGTNVLVLAPAFTESEDDLCSCLLSGAPAAKTDALTVTFSDDAGDRLAAWEQRHDRLPANLGIVEVGGQTDSHSMSGRAAIDVRTVSKPGDLTGTGVRLSQLLSDWREAETDTQTVACFYGLSVLLQYVESTQLHRFLHIVVRRMEEAAAVAHFHFDPNLIEEQQLGRLLSLFDVVVEYDDGEWRSHVP